ncbi:hypothetical protein [Streptomyces coeruleofuscus]|uniref:hypothetical protein n=1 Tax=Streptomyces coeruleofuscus TaxID=66879 RepID=UPI0031FA13F2
MRRLLERQQTGSCRRGMCVRSLKRSVFRSTEPGRTNVTSLAERRLAQLPPDTRPLPSLAAYDQLLRARQSADRPAIQKEMP